MNPKRLIEEWLPIKEIGVESRRENSTGQHPPPNRLHVWWARRPLTASRAAILGSLLPAWEGNGELLGKHFADEAEYRRWFLRMLGMLGDPVAAQAKMEAIKNGTYRPRNKQDARAFTFGRAFRTRLDDSDVAVLEAILGGYLGNRKPVVMDPMSGGGSIPFEAIRMGLPTVASELNPVACLVLDATLRLPLEFGPALAADISKWGRLWLDRATAKLEPYYSQPYSDGIAMARVWARTVPCPTTGKPIPLSPNWWLRRQAGDAVAIHMLPCQDDWAECRFEIVRGSQSDLEQRYAPSQGTIRRGNAVSPWSGDPVPGDYIKQVAQSKGMGEQLVTIEVVRGKSRGYEPPHEEELAAVGRAEVALAESWDNWLAAGLIPTEPIYPGNKTAEPRRYGMYRWHKLFAPRQLLAMLTYLESLEELVPEMELELGKERAAAVRTYLAFALDKCANYGILSLCILARSLSQSRSQTYLRSGMTSAIKWSFAEMNMALKDRGAFPWALEPGRGLLQGAMRTGRTIAAACSMVWAKRAPPIQLQVTRANAARLTHLPDESVDAVVVDPPYGNNVMYAELSDFFYVWLKRSVGDLYPWLVRLRARR